MYAQQMPRVGRGALWLLGGQVGTAVFSALNTQNAQENEVGFRDRVFVSRLIEAGRCIVLSPADHSLLLLRPGDC